MKQFTGVVSMQFDVLTDKQYAARVQYFSDQDHAIKAEEKWTEYFYNALMRSVIHADPSHLGKLIQASKLWQKYRSTQRILKSMKLPWKWDDIENPKADVPKANKEKLAYMRANWERDFITYLDKEDSLQQEKVEWTKEKWQAAILRLVKQGKEHNVMNEEIRDVIRMALEA